MFVLQQECHAFTVFIPTARTTYENITLQTAYNVKLQQLPQHARAALLSACAAEGRGKSESAVGAVNPTFSQGWVEQD